MSPERQPNASYERATRFVPSQEMFEIAAIVPCGSPDTFGATPLDHAAAYDQQFALIEELKTLVEQDVPEDTPEGIAEFMKDTFVSRFYLRGTANHENYLTALHTCEEFADSPQAIDVLNRAKVGHACPAELLLVRKMLGIRSAELACLTHPYRHRLEYIEVMRDAVRQGVELLGGTYFETPTTRYRAKNVVNESRWEAEYSEGIFMTRKRDLGTMPDGTIIRERTSFIIRTDTEGAVPQENIEAIRKLDMTDPTWQDEAVRVGHLDIIADSLLEADELSLVIPVSTTIYAFNPETAALIEVREMVRAEVIRRQQEEDMRLRFPNLLAHIDAVRNGDMKRPTKDIGDMLFVGPHESAYTVESNSVEADEADDKENF